MGTLGRPREVLDLRRSDASHAGDLGKASHRLTRKFLAEVAQRENLDAIHEDLVDDAIRMEKDLAHRRLMPLRNHSTLVGKFTQEFNASDQALEPIEGGVRSVLSDVVDCGLGSPSRCPRPDDSQRVSLARSSATTSSWGTPSPRANSALACRMSRTTSISSINASY